MPVKRRIPKTRRVVFDAETLALFVRLDAMPRSYWGRSNEAKELAIRLNLVDEWWGGQSPLDKSEAPCHPEWTCAHHDWHKCRRVREQLLEAAEEAEQQLGMATEPTGVPLKVN